MVGEKSRCDGEGDGDCDWCRCNSWPMVHVGEDGDLDGDGDALWWLVCCGVAVVVLTFVVVVVFIRVLNKTMECPLQCFAPTSPMIKSTSMNLPSRPGRPGLSNQ